MISENPLTAGSFADIFKGYFKGQSVCMKVIRIYQATQVDHFLKVTPFLLILPYNPFDIDTLSAILKRGHTLGTIIAP